MMIPRHAFPKKYLNIVILPESLRKDAVLLSPKIFPALTDKVWPIFWDMTVLTMHQKGNQLVLKSS